MSTLRTLTDPERRHPLPRQPLSDEVIRTQLVEQFVLESYQFLLCLRKARRGAAPGPSGMTSDHLFPLLSSEGDSELFAQVGSLLANGNVPDTIIQALRLGRLTALSKPDCGVRGIVVGDIIRRVVARTIAKQPQRPSIQYALSTKAGCECVAHILQSMTDVDPSATVVSRRVRSDLQKRNVGGPLEDGRWRSDPPLCEVLLLWQPIHIFVGRRDGRHSAHPTGRGRGARRPFDAHVVALGQHGSLAAAQARLRVGERLMAFLADIYAVCAPDRVGAVRGARDAGTRSHPNAPRQDTSLEPRRSGARRH